MLDLEVPQPGPQRLVKPPHLLAAELKDFARTWYEQYNSARRHKHGEYSRWYDVTVALRKFARELEVGVASPIAVGISQPKALLYLYDNPVYTPAHWDLANPPALGQRYLPWITDATLYDALRSTFFSDK